MKKAKKNLLDEMQEQKALRIEHNGFWIAFIGLCVAIAIECLVFRDVAMAAGEVAVLAVMGGYMEVACIRNGIWDRTLKADGRTNFRLSLIGGVVGGLLRGISSYLHSGDLLGAVLTFVALAVFIFVLCEIGLTLCTSLYKRKKSALEALADQDEA